MTHTSATSDVKVASRRTTGWVGWIIFAAIMMMLSGGADITWGIVALVRKQVFVAGPAGNVVNLNYSAWGWITLILGIVVFCAGLGVLKGSTWAYIIAVALAALNVLNNLFVIKALPVWSVTIIALNVLVIYAITVHGSEMRQVRRL